MSEKQEINVILSGGSAKGLAHIGVLSVLEKHFKINSIIGTSMGAIVGGLYCYGYNTDEIVELVKGSSTRKLFTIFKPSLRNTGLFKGKALLSYFEEMTKNANIENCKINFAAAAFDLNSTSTVLIDRGNLAKAMRASSSLPFLIQPLKYGKYLFVDGYIEQPLPLRFANRYGKKIVAASSTFPPLPRHADSFSLSEEGEETELPGMFTTFFKTLLHTQASMALQAIVTTKPDIYISAYSDSLKLWELDEVDEFVEIGRKSAEESVSNYFSDKDRSVHESFFDNLKAKHEEFWNYLKDLSK